MGEIGASRTPKKLIVCCDGTWMNSDIGWTSEGLFKPGHAQTPSNVTRLARALSHEDKHGRSQISYYQSGVGTNWSAGDRLLGGGLALGLSEHIREAYGFLVHNYLHSHTEADADEVYLIGFSRGAFTARSVSGMICSLGLLDKDAMPWYYQIFQDYENAGDERYQPILPRDCNEFKLVVSPGDVEEYLSAYKAELLRLGWTREINVKAVGVFDTVGSLGLPITPLLQKAGLPTTLHTYRFFDTGLDDHVLNAFQVLALDEHRSAFSPAVWSRKEGGQTNLKQVWMSGVHSNIGGGTRDTAMSDLSLAWMMSQLEPFLHFNEHYLIKQLHLTKATYKEPLWRWGLGKLDNSMKFPTSLAGSIVRTPSLYQVTNFATGKADGQYLINTHEKMHLSTRARMTMGGLSYDGNKYSSPALKSWAWKEAGDIGKPGYWEYQSEDGRTKRVLEEDELGYYEKLVLNLDDEAVTRFMIAQS